MRNPSPIVPLNPTPKTRTLSCREIRDGGSQRMHLASQTTDHQHATYRRALSPERLTQKPHDYTPVSPLPRRKSSGNGPPVGCLTLSVFHEVLGSCFSLFSQKINKAASLRPRSETTFPAPGICQAPTQISLALRPHPCYSRCAFVALVSPFVLKSAAGSTCGLFLFPIPLYRGVWRISERRPASRQKVSGKRVLQIAFTFKGTHL